MFISKEARLAYGRLAAAMEKHGEPVCSQTDPEEWFPEKGGSTALAKMYCKPCPLKKECLEFALKNNELFGIWGGVGPRTRRRMPGRAVGSYNRRED